jgi:uncharacterized protein YndB with AHSA1/START domain
VPRLEVTRDLPVGLEAGFDYITDVENWPTYWPKLLEIREPETIRWREPGDTATVVVEARGKPTTMHMTLGEFVPYDRVVYTSTQEGLPRFRHERHFREAGGRLRYTLVIEYDPRRALRGAVDRLLVPRHVRASLVETMDNLERVFADR